MNYPLLQYTVDSRDQLIRAAIGDLQYLEKAAVRTISRSKRRDRDFIARLQAAPVSPAQSGPAQSARPSQLESPLLYLAVGPFHIHSEVRVWIDPLDLRYGSADADCFVNVKLRLDRMVPPYWSGHNQTAK